MKLKNNKLDLVKKLIAASVILITFYFFGRTIIRNWEQVKEIGFQVDGWTAAALFMFVAAVIVSGWLWGILLRRLAGSDSKTITNKELMSVHIGSWLLKYVPGQVGSVLGKLVWGTSKGLLKSVVGTSFFYENVFLLISSFLLSFPIVSYYAFEDILGSKSTFVPLLFLLPSLIIFHKGLFYKLVNTSVQKLRGFEFKEELVLSRLEILKYLVLYSLPRVINALGFVLLAITLFEISSEHYLIFGATYILAGIIGLLAVFVPSGIGVREGVIILFLSEFIGTTEAVVLSIYARFLTTLADIVLTAIYLIIRKQSNGQGNSIQKHD